MQNTKRNRDTGYDRDYQNLRDFLICKKEVMVSVSVVSLSISVEILLKIPHELLRTSHFRLKKKIC